MYQVILVDDEVLMREAVKENMDWAGQNCALAGCFQHGREALDFIRANPVDIVLTDICMPFVDGLELSRCLSEEYPDIRIIIISGYDSFEYAKQAMKYKVSEYLLKPFSVTELTEILAGVVGKLDRERAENQNIVQIRQSYRKNRILLKSKLLMNLICGSQTVEELREELNKHGINLDRRYYCVAVLNVSVNEADKQQTELYSFAVYNIADEIIRETQAGHVLQRMDCRVLLLLAANCPGTDSQKLPLLFDSIIKAVKRCMNLDITAGVGSFVERTTDLHLSYEEAEDMLQYEYLWGKGHVFYKESIGNRGASGDWKDKREAIYEAATAGRRGKVKELMEDMTEAIKNSYIKKEWACLILQDTLRGALKLLELVGLAGLEIGARTERAVGLAGEAGSLEAAKDIVLDIYGQIMDAIEELREKKGEKRAVLAADYIKNHYMEPELSLQSICAYMAMSPSRFSAMFKESTGMGFVEALTKVRMEKARELLETADLKNYEIAEQVGFADPHYFSLSFKKAVGMSPTEYAKEKRR